MKRVKNKYTGLTSTQIHLVQAYLEELLPNSWQARYFDMYYNQEMSTKQIAKKDGLNPASVAKRMKKMIDHALLPSTQYLCTLTGMYPMSTLKGEVLRRCCLAQESKADVAEHLDLSFHVVRETSLFFTHIEEHEHDRRAYYERNSGTQRGHIRGDF